MSHEAHNLGLHQNLTSPYNVQTATRNIIIIQIPEHQEKSLKILGA